MTNRRPDDDSSAPSHQRRRFLTPRALSAALRAGAPISDEDFNAFLPPRFQGGEGLQSTPVPVAIRAAQLLAEGRAVRVLDVAAGVGTLGILGALTTPSFFMGIEPALPLVVAARGTADRFGAANVRFFHGNIAQIDFWLYDAIYLPAAEVRRVDGGARDSADRSDAWTWQKLEETRPETRILMAGVQRPPPKCHLIKAEVVDSIELRLFERD